jgi:hypothetical protein
MTIGLTHLRCAVPSLERTSRCSCFYELLMYFNDNYHFLVFTAPAPVLPAGLQSKNRMFEMQNAVQQLRRFIE